MAFRTFVDGEGQEWQAYTVVPPADERRRADRRDTDLTPAEASSAVEADSASDDRRDSDDRRLTVGRVSRVFRAEPQGWLVFESGAERRRLSPIPDEWTHATDEELERYRQSAKPVAQTPHSSEAVTERNP
jgi:hypothetical protein